MLTVVASESTTSNHVVASLEKPNINWKESSADMTLSMLSGLRWVEEREAILVVCSETPTFIDFDHRLSGDHRSKFLDRPSQTEARYPAMELRVVAEGISGRRARGYEITFRGEIKMKCRKLA